MSVYYTAGENAKNIVEYYGLKTIEPETFNELEGKGEPGCQYNTTQEKYHWL
jgi:hypothetical protein